MAKKTTANKPVSRTPAQSLEADSLQMHASGRPGKIEITPTKPLTTQRDLSLAYSPGVAAPCLRIADDPNLAYDYTAKGNMVAVVSNGTAVLGLGAIGAQAAKPVMEGKGVLFKRFADIDGVDLLVDTTDVDEFVNCVRFLGCSFGGINLEDIKAPECFVVEQRLRELLDIPVFHDDQHGTAIIVAAAFINALDLTNRSIKKTKLVVNGAGAAGVACVELLQKMGMPPENAILCDSRGVVYRGRSEGMNQWKSALAVDTDARTLADAFKGADAAFGLSAKGAFTKEMIASMADNPIIFAMANPDPEITPEDVAQVRNDAIMATGRSDYANQVNNVLGFPYLFRGALDVRASAINDDMKIAAAHAIASLARGDVPDEVTAAYAGRQLRYGPEYILPTPFDARLIATVPPAVAKAAMDSGVARKPIEDLEAYRTELSARLDPTVNTLDLIFAELRKAPRSVVFAEGEEEQVIRAAAIFRNSGYGHPVLIGREDRIQAAADRIGLGTLDGIEMHNARLSKNNARYTDFVYGRLQRKGALLRDCQRMVNQDRNVFGACMVELGDADAMVTGMTRSYSVAFEDVTRVLDPKPGRRIIGLTIMIARGRTVFIADTNVHEFAGAEELADIAVQSATKARQMGHEPRVALLSYSNFGAPPSESARRIEEAVALLDERSVDFEYDGEMAPDVALDYDHLKQFYPFSRLSGPANVLVMPGLHSANISAKLLQMLGGGTVIGPLLLGLSKPVVIVQRRATVSDIVNLAALAAHDAVR